MLWAWKFFYTFVKCLEEEFRVVFGATRVM